MARGWSRVGLLGASDLADVVILLAKSYPIEIVGIASNTVSSNVRSDIVVRADMNGFDGVDGWQGHDGHRTGHRGPTSPEIGAGMQGGESTIEPGITHQCWKAIHALQQRWCSAEVRGILRLGLETRLR